MIINRPFHILLAVALVVGCKPPAPAPELPVYVSLTEADTEFALANADSVVAIGAPVTTETVFGDSASGIEFRQHRTTRWVQIYVQEDDNGRIVARQISQRPLSHSRVTIGNVSCTLTCRAAYRGGACTHRGCEPDTSVPTWPCTNGYCDGNCDYVDCVRQVGGLNKKGQVIIH